MNYKAELGIPQARWATNVRPVQNLTPGQA